MRNLFLSLFLVTSFISCNNPTNDQDSSVKNTEVLVDINEYENFGEAFELTELITNDEMREFYAEMEVGDSLEVTFNAKVNSICQKKGCWMTLDLGDGDAESFVKFKDYEFFVPMDAANSDAIIKGMAYKNETTVEELRHYAQDAGKSQEEIDAIVEPRIEYTFMADGVYLKKNNSES